MEPKRILLVEDNPDDEALTLRAFKHCPIPNTVVVARDGAEALTLLFGSEGSQEESQSVLTGRLPHLILLDLKLPKYDGLEILKRIRNEPHTKFVPVVMLTTSVEEKDLINCYSYGCNSYMRKPVDFLEFTEVVKQLGLYWLLLNHNPFNG